MGMGTPRVLLDGLAFPEGPRWHGDRLWFSDIHAHHVITVDLAGHSDIKATLDDMPSGIGFLPDDSPLVMSMRKRQLLRFNGGRLELFADLSHFHGYFISDMVVDQRGRTYVGNRNKRYGSELPAQVPDGGPDSLILVDADGSARVVAEGLMGPNGCAITPDSRTLVVGESGGCRLIAFDIGPDGSLSGRRVHANLVGRCQPDGICMDAEGGIWVASPATGEYVRVIEGGEITDRIVLKEKWAVSCWAVACVLGGPERRVLFMMNSVPTLEDLSRFDPDVAFRQDHQTQSQGWIETVTVDIPGAGLP